MMVASYLCLSGKQNDQYESIHQLLEKIYDNYVKIWAGARRSKITLGRNGNDQSFPANEGD